MIHVIVFLLLLLIIFLCCCKKNFKRKKSYIKKRNPQPLRHSVQRMFFKFSQLYVVLNFQIIHQLSGDWTWLVLLKLIRINFKNKFLHNSIDWLGLYLQISIPPWLGNFFRFTVFRLLENAFGKFYSPSGMIWSLVPDVQQQLPSYICGLNYGGQGGSVTLCFIFITFPNFKKFITFVVQTLAFLAKLPTHCVFQSDTVWLWNFPNSFNPALKNHIAKDLMKILSWISNKVPSLCSVTFCEKKYLLNHKSNITEKKG